MHIYERVRMNRHNYISLHGWASLSNVFSLHRGLNLGHLVSFVSARQIRIGGRAEVFPRSKAKSDRWENEAFVHKQAYLRAFSVCLSPKCFLLEARWAKRSEPSVRPHRRRSVRLGRLSLRSSSCIQLEKQTQSVGVKRTRREELWWKRWTEICCKKMFQHRVIIHWKEGGRNKCNR